MRLEMPGLKILSHAGVPKAPSGHGDFHGYLARNLSDAFRLAVMTLDDPIAAGAIVHDAITSVWHKTGAESERDADDAFRRRLDSDLESAIRQSIPDEGAAPVEPLQSAIDALNPRLQLELARAFGPWEATESAPGAENVAAGGSATDALRALGARLDAGDLGESGRGDPEPRLRALYEARDPGAPAPLQLRLRLQQDYREGETAASERALRTRASGWGFAINAFLAFAALTLVVALASTVDVRASSVTSGDPMSDPTSPLTISSMSLVQGGIEGGDVHVGATQQTLIVEFPPSPLWHLSSKDCQADVLGVIDWQGQTTWVGGRAGHADAIVGDPSSPSAFVVGPGSYCELGRFISTDGGSTWSAGALPGGSTSGPAWLAFDPSHTHNLLVYYPGLLYVSSDAGLSWISRKSTVTPLAFDSSGRLVGWTSGKLFESLDEGASWQQTGAGPADPPDAAGATADGVLIGASDGLWWYPLTSAPSLVQSGRVFSIATLTQGAVVLGADANGHPWLGTVDNTEPGIALAALSPEIAALQITGGGVAVNDMGAVVAFAGSSSLLALATFAR